MYFITYIYKTHPIIIWRWASNRVKNACYMFVTCLLMITQCSKACGISWISECFQDDLLCVTINSIVLMIPCVLSLVGCNFAGMAPVWFAPYGSVRFLSLLAQCGLLWNPRLVEVCFGLIQWRVPNGVCFQAGIIHTSENNV